MYKSQPRFHKRDRVRLRPGVDPSIYGDFACVGNEGVVTDTRADRWDLPEVFVQWDKNHWAYNGIPDCWTFEDHFELVENSMADNSGADFLNMLARGLQELLATNDKPKSEPKEEKGGMDLISTLIDAGRAMSQVQEEKDSPDNDEFQEAMASALAMLEDAEGFLVLGVERKTHPRSPEGVLEPFITGYSKTPESDILVAAYMARVAAGAHQELALNAIAQLED